MQKSWLIFVTIGVIVLIAGVTMMGRQRWQGSLFPSTNSPVTISSSFSSSLSSTGTPECGDGVLDEGEECDDGNDICNDGCSCECKTEYCGDGILQSGLGEECDDGNTTNWDGCSSTCKSEQCPPGKYYCSSTNCILCGSQIGIPVGPYFDDSTCGGNCPLHCGDGILNPPEQCDDGNAVSGDGCSAFCHIETEYCGDGTIQEGEECDDGNEVDTDTCTLACKNAKCGDNIVQEGVEDCDDGNSTNDDGCTNDCKYASCGNGIVQEGEECDDGNTDNSDACVDSCKNAKCGDGFVWEGTEECDDANTSNEDACSTACKKQWKKCKYRCDAGPPRHWTDVNSCTWTTTPPTQTCPPLPASCNPGAVGQITWCKAS